MSNLFIFSSSIVKQFCVKFLLFCSPLLLLVIPYFITDPFKVLYEYDRYTPDNGSPMYININRSMVSTKLYIKNNPRYHYDSFIFGSSRSGFFQVNDWKQHIGDSSSCFHFDEYGGSLYMIYKKVMFVDNYSEIKNALLCIDDWVLYDAVPPTTPLHACPPELNDNKGMLDFQSIYLKAYLSPKFLFPYNYWLLSRNIASATVPAIVDCSPYYIDTVTNQVGIDSLRYGFGHITTDRNLLRERPKMTQRHPDYIMDEQFRMLTEIKNVFENNCCNYKVVINPTFDQRKLSVNDMEILISIFGNHLYDFSGINKFTENPNNYFDEAHFNSSVAKEIMNIIYE